MKCMTAWTRLAAIAAAALALWSLACRPTWSKDGRRLVYVGRDGGRNVIAEHDLDSGKTRVLSRDVPTDGATSMHWDDAGKRWIVVEADGAKDTFINVMTLGADGKQRSKHSIDIGTRNVSALANEPVVVGEHVFVTGRQPLRIAIDTGETTKPEQPRGRSAPVMFAYGDGVGYACAPAIHGNQRWEIGTVDRETMALTPLLSCPEGCEWDVVPFPQFDARQERCAIVGFQGNATGDPGDRKWALLVLEGDELISTIELKGRVSAGPVHWLDAVTIAAVVVRIGEQHDTFVMFESDFSGSVTRETELVRLPIDEKMVKRSGATMTLALPFAMQPSVSPDGHTVAFTTALLPKLPEERSGLLLLDRRDKERQVKRIPFDVTGR